jgi:hypothetical protein
VKTGVKPINPRGKDASVLEEDLGQLVALATADLGFPDYLVRFVAVCLDSHLF